MAPLPDRILSWLWSVLQSYAQPRLAYDDVAAALSQYPSLQPRTAIYTYEDGHTSLLLSLFGTIPVDFRGAQYRYPVEIWIPQEYGAISAGLMCYVKPDMGRESAVSRMIVRPGQHVAMDGRVYHPYLRDWGVHEVSLLLPN